MSADRRQRFWRRTLRLSAGLLVVWALVSVLVPWFARELDEFEAFGFPLGWWLAAEGALLVYLGLIVVYVIAMERLEARWHAELPSAIELSAAPAAGGAPGSA